MNTPTTPFHVVQPLIQNTELTGSRFQCTFACPVTGKTARGQADVAKANDSIATRVKGQLFSSALKSMTRTITRMVRSVLGNNVVGKAAGDVANHQARIITPDTCYGAKELEMATIAAFEQVRTQFAWDEQNERYVHSSVALQTV